MNAWINALLRSLQLHNESIDCELWCHLSDMNVVFYRLRVFWKKKPWKTGENETIETDLMTLIPDGVLYVYTYLLF